LQYGCDSHTGLTPPASHAAQQTQRNNKRAGRTAHIINVATRYVKAAEKSVKRFARRRAAECGRSVADNLLIKNDIQLKLTLKPPLFARHPAGLQGEAQAAARRQRYAFTNE